MKTYPALFELDEIGEATGQVLVFCSLACRSEHGTPDQHVAEDSELPDHNYHCCQCGEDVQ